MRGFFLVTSLTSKFTKYNNDRQSLNKYEMTSARIDKINDKSMIFESLTVEGKTKPNTTNPSQITKLREQPPLSRPSKYGPVGKHLE